MTAGDIPFATNLLEQAVGTLSNRELVNALSLLAECYSSIGQYKKAADTFDRVASLVPGTKIAQNSRYEVGKLAMDHIGDFGRARTAFTAYIASPLGGQLKESSYMSLCKIYEKEGAHRNALQCFNDFLRMFPSSYRSPFARLWRGVLYQDVEQRWKAAEQDLLTFVRQKPRHPRCEEARYRIALGRYHMGNKKGALKMIKEYKQEHPGGQYQIRVNRLQQALRNSNLVKRSN
jgi:TolA-binding protein